jgi:Cdc6-like AAA superfamily ATPase
MLGMTDREGIHRLGLISDRALAPGEEDRFAHDDFVDQLEALIRSGIDTANIALYGSWGAGKSGISRRLAGRFTSRWDKKHFHFVELNAFKYADAPLLRAFIYRIAEVAVPGKAEAYRRRLYEHASRSEPTVPGRWRGGLKLAALLVASLSIAVAVLLLALPAGSTYHTVLDVLRTLAPSTIVVGVLVTVASSVLPSFKAEHEMMAPASAEQFEQLFEDLVRKDIGVSGKDDTRLIVFIDELDRCSAGEVARTLETLRTFVNIPGCIFVVAADQQVLEHALTEHVRQSTPADTINPYYSAGSGYLDKIFEYQLSLPSLLPNRLVDFAATLVEDIGGVWSELDELDAVLSVLIPVHVRSPRRVKVLLNRFAMAYEIARKRVAAGSLGDDLPQRAAELAKLVCIRTEFPLFAAELERDTRVISVIELMLRRDEDEDPGAADERLERVDPELCRRAERIVHGGFAVDELLSKDEPSEDENDGERRQEALSTAVTVRRAHAAQLVDFLRQTEQVPGPRQDLVNLESIGASFGADPGFAMDLESAALGNQTRRVLELMTVAEPEERPLGLLVLAELVRRSRGFDARNVMRSLLRASESTEDPIENVAPRLARQLEESGATVGPEEIAGALRLAVLGESARLTDELIARPELISSAAARHCALRLSPRLIDHRKRLGSIATYEVEHEPGTLATILGELSDGEATSVITAAAEGLESELSAAAQQAEQEIEQPDEHEGSARLDALLAAIGELTEALAADGHRQAAERALLVLVNFTAAPVVAKLDELQEKLAPIASEAAVRMLASDLTRRQVTDWRELLDHLDRDTLRTVFTVELEDALATQWWTKWQKVGEAEVAALRDALGDLRALRELQPRGELTDLSENVSSGLGARFTSEDVDILEHRIRGASMLVGARLLNGEIVGALTVARVGEIVVAELAPPLEPPLRAARRDPPGRCRRCR